VLLVGTGTGLAPFASMIKEIYHNACEGKSDSIRYTLLHTNRTFEELGYHQELFKIEASDKFDFLYFPSVSRPIQRDREDRRLGKGRANNMLRTIFQMPLKEEQELREIAAREEDVSAAKAALEKTVRPVLPEQITLAKLHQRLDPESTVILTCGNPSSMADIKFIADSNRIRFEKEDW
jgi:ferredoxin-NADP reductase